MQRSRGSRLLGDNLNQLTMLDYAIHLTRRHLEFYWSYSRCISEFKLGALLSHSKVWVEWDNEDNCHSRFGICVNRRLGGGAGLCDAVSIPLAVDRCLFCEEERQLKPRCTKQRWKVCKDHFMVRCPKCGYECFWMENMESGSCFACFSLSCNWTNKTPPPKHL